MSKTKSRCCCVWFPPKNPRQEWSEAVISRLAGPSWTLYFSEDQLPEINRRRLLFPSAPESKQRRAGVGFLNQGNQLVFLLQ